jgi:hypothetical protein
MINARGLTPIIHRLGLVVSKAFSLDKQKFKNIPIQLVNN